jgi:hypothetical protein
MRNVFVDRIFLYGVAGIGAACVCVAQSLRKRSRLPELGQVVGAFLAGHGVVAAAWLGWQGLVPSAALSTVPGSGELRAYLILSALAVAWVSVTSIASNCSPPAPTSPKWRPARRSCNLFRQRGR